MGYNGAVDSNPTILQQPLEPQELHLAYSLNDVYQYLRLVMRLDAIIVGIGLGLILLLPSRTALENWGVYTAGPVWPVRLIAGLLITLGVMLLLAASERIVPASAMVAMVLGNAFVAVILLVAYLQDELTLLGVVGQLGLILVFAVCLVAAIFPFSHIRREYQGP